MKNKDIIVSKGSRAFWRTCAAAVSYLCAIVLSGMVIINIYPNSAEQIIFIAIIAFVPIILVLSMGVHYSRVRNLYFDLQGMQYKKEYVVGPVKTGRWVTLSEIEYVSVFREKWSKDRDDDGATDTSGHNYQVNVWHKTSKHSTVYSSVAPEPAFEVARQIAIKLQVDLLNATLPNESKWIDLKRDIDNQTA